MNERDLASRLRASAPPAAAAPELTLGPQAPVDVAYVVHDSPLGRLLLALTPRGLARIAYLDASDEAAELAELAARLSPRVLRAPARLEGPRRELDEFFAGGRRHFEFPLDLGLVRTGFRRRVLAASLRIPYGEARSYRDLAAAAGSPGAFRAAGTALGSNPLPIVIPCHRVVHAGGGLGGYTGGLERKRALLALEGSRPER